MYQFICSSLPLSISCTVSHRTDMSSAECEQIRIVMRFDTDKHPSPDKASAQSGLNSAYTITADYCIE